MAGRKREVKWTPRATEDKLAIMEYWYQRNKSTSYPKKLERLFEQSLELLSIHPEIGRVFRFNPPIYYKTVRRNRLYYIFNNENIIILAIWDTRRNPDKFKL